MTAYSSALAETLAPDLLARFDRYVRIDTQAARDRTRCPRTPGQLELAALLAHELGEIGLSDAAVDDNGYVTATLPASGGGDPATVIGAHLARRYEPRCARRRRHPDRASRLRRRGLRRALCLHDRRLLIVHLAASWAAP